MDINYDKEPDLRPGLQGPAGSSDDATDSKEMRRFDLEFRIRYNILLHEDYAAHYGRMCSMSTFVSIFIGTAAFANFQDAFGPVVFGAVGLASAIFGILSVVLKFVDRFYEFRNAVYVYKAMLGKVRNGCDDATLEDVEREYNSFDVFFKENNVSAAISYNATCDQMYGDVGERFRVPFFKSLTRFFIPWGRITKKMQLH